MRSAAATSTSPRTVRTPLHFIFYELYLDDAAVEAHRAAPHFAAWRKAAGDCVVPGSQVNTFCNQRFHHPYETPAV